jgi:hypothetical protein
MELDIKGDVNEQQLLLDFFGVVYRIRGVGGCTVVQLWDAGFRTPRQVAAPSDETLLTLRIRNRAALKVGLSSAIKDWESMVARTGNRMSWPPMGMTFDHDKPGERK